MRISAKLSAVKGTSWSDNLLRFVLGGGITVAAALIALRFGPVVGGLFLAFPAIFPATATLIEKREKHKKAGIAHEGAQRGRLAAAVDARGTCLGCVGLVAFAGTIWGMIANHSLLLSLLAATAAWALVSILLWTWRWPAARLTVPASTASTGGARRG